jgi:SAM-dependent methyltransferase
MIALLLRFVAFFVFSTPLYAESPEEVFTKIYEQKIWGINEENGRSGGGSSLKATVEYRQFLECLLKIGNIHSVVDAGCGEWEFSKKIDWSGILYIGYDVVRAIVEKDQKAYGCEHIQFVHADILSTDLPSADLLICKDLLQHLTNADIMALIAQFPKYKYCLIVNDVDKKTKSSLNRDMALGMTRTVDLTQPPFNLDAKKVFTYPVDYVGGGASCKQVLLIIHP